MANEPTIDVMNEAIALFDGYERYEDKYGIWFKREGLIKCLHPKLQDLEYHEDWNKLIHVIKKIKGMHMDILRQTFVMDYMRATGPMNSGLVFLDKEKTHKGVYEFLMWYYQQKQNDANA